jgi:hypothetical protein
VVGTSEGSEICFPSYGVVGQPRYRGDNSEGTRLAVEETLCWGIIVESVPDFYWPWGFFVCPI